MLLLLVIALIISLYNCEDEKPTIKELLPIDNLTEEWTGKQNLPGKKGSNEKIEIPGISSLCFEAGNTKQLVNFYNPNSNEDILFLMSLHINESEIWKADGLCSSGKGYYEITLNESLEVGEYEAYLLIECYRTDGTRLNGAKIEFQLYVQ